MKKLMEPDDLQEPEHAKYNPSSLSLFERCPGYMNREDDTNALAERGTRIHKALETDNLEPLDKEKERPVAQMCVDFIEGLLADRLPLVPCDEFREIKLRIDLTGDISTFGTCDRLFIFGSQGDMIDYKSGYREVTDAETNPQAWAYVIGAFQRFLQLDLINFYFLIPNRDEILYHCFHRSDVPAMQLRLHAIIRRAMEADPKLFNPQGELCCYCKRAATCPALASKAIDLVKRIRPDIQVPVNSFVVDPNHPEDVPHLLRLAPLMEEWAKTIRSEALRLSLEEGLEFPGFKRCERATPRGTTSVIGAYDAVKDLISLEDFLLSCSKVSVPDLEKLFRATAKRGQKKAAASDLERRLRSADVFKPEGTIYYLRESKA